MCAYMYVSFEYLYERMYVNMYVRINECEDWKSKYFTQYPPRDPLLTSAQLYTMEHKIFNYEENHVIAAYFVGTFCVYVQYVYICMYS